MAVDSYRACEPCAFFNAVLLLPTLFLSPLFTSYGGWGLSPVTLSLPYSPPLSPSLTYAGLFWVKLNQFPQLKVHLVIVNLLHRAQMKESWAHFVWIVGVVCVCRRVKAADLHLDLHRYDVVIEMQLAKSSAPTHAPLPAGDGLLSQTVREGNMNRDCLNSLCVCVFASACWTATAVRWSENAINMNQWQVKVCVCVSSTVGK